MMLTPWGRPKRSCSRGVCYVNQSRLQSFGKGFKIPTFCECHLWTVPNWRVGKRGLARRNRSPLRNFSDAFVLGKRCQRVKGQSGRKNMFRRPKSANFARGICGKSTSPLRHRFGSTSMAAGQWYEREEESWWRLVENSPEYRLPFV